MIDLSEPHSRQPRQAPMEGNFLGQRLDLPPAGGAEKSALRHRGRLRTPSDPGKQAHIPR